MTTSIGRHTSSEHPGKSQWVSQGSMFRTGLGNEPEGAVARNASPLQMTGRRAASTARKLAPVVDMPAHFLPKSWPDFASRHGGAAGRRCGTAATSRRARLGTGARATCCVGRPRLPAGDAPAGTRRRGSTTSTPPASTCRSSSATPILFQWGRPAAAAVDVARHFNDAALEMCAGSGGRLRALPGAAAARRRGVRQLERDGERTRRCTSATSARATSTTPSSSRSSVRRRLGARCSSPVGHGLRRRPPRPAHDGRRWGCPSRPTCRSSRWCWAAPSTSTAVAQAVLRPRRRRLPSSSAVSRMRGSSARWRAASRSTHRATTSTASPSTRPSSTTAPSSSSSIPWAPAA